MENKLLNYLMWVLMGLSTILIILNSLEIEYPLWMPVTLAIIICFIVGMLTQIILQNQEDIQELKKQQLETTHAQL